MLCAAPLAAIAFNWRWPVATTSNRAVLLAVPLIPVALGLVWLDVWLEVRGGYVEPDSKDADVAYQVLGVLALIVGAVLMCLVAAAAWWGARRGLRRPFRR